MNNFNMRRVLKQPTSLRMANGGDLADHYRSKLSQGTLTARAAQQLGDMETASNAQGIQRYGIDSQANTAANANDTQRYGIDSQSRTAENANNTQRYGIDVGAASSRYGADAGTRNALIGSEASTRNALIGADAQTRSSLIGADASRYGSDNSLRGSVYGADAGTRNTQISADAGTRNALIGADSQTRSSLIGAGASRYSSDNSLAASLYGSDTQRYGINVGADTQRYATDAKSYSDNRNADNQRYGIDVGADTSRYNTNVQADTTRYGVNVGADTSRYNTNVQANTAANANDTQRYGINVGADTSRYSTDSRRYSDDRNADNQRYGINVGADTTLRTAAMQANTAANANDTQRYGINVGADTQRHSTNVGADTQRYGINVGADTQRYGISTQANTAANANDTQRYGISTQANTAANANDTQRYGISTQANTAANANDTQRYGISTQANTAANANDTQRYGINVGADTSRYNTDAAHNTQNHYSTPGSLANGGRVLTGPAAQQGGRSSFSQYGGQNSFAQRGTGGQRIGLRDGGEVSPWSLKGMYNAVAGPKETVTEKYARQDAERAARNPKKEVVAQEPAAGISGYVGNSALQRREAAAGLQDGGEINPWIKEMTDPTSKRFSDVESRISSPTVMGPQQQSREIYAMQRKAMIEGSGRRKYDDLEDSSGNGFTPFEAMDARWEKMAAGSVAGRALRQPHMQQAGTLRNGGGLGGNVPGTGKGDKIPAMYEPGEFVVSNAMLKAEPGLRDQLHGLRTEVLAAKGMTPQEADAKAAGGGRLHAEEGATDETVAAGTGAVSPEEAKKLAAQTAAYVAGAKAAAEAAKVAAAGGANGQNQGTVAGAGPANSGGATGGGGDSDVRGAVGGVPGGASGGDGSGVSAPTLTDSIMPRTRAGLREVGAAMSEAVDQGKYAKALGKFTTGSVGAVKNIADDVLGGFARGAYGAARDPVEDFGRGVLGMEDRKEPARPGVAPATAPVPNDSLAGDATMPGQDPRRAAPETLRGATGTEVGKGIMRYDVAGKAPLFTNLTGAAGMADNEALLGRRPMTAQNQGALDGIQARQDIGDQKLATKMQYDSEVSAANATNAWQEKQRLANYIPGGGLNDLQSDNHETLRRAAIALARVGSLPADVAARAQGQKLADSVYARYNQAMTDKQTGARQDSVNETNLGVANIQTEAKGREDARARAAAAETAKRQQFNDDRKYKLDVEKYGIETANKARDDGRAASEALDKRIDGLVGVDKEGKPDVAVANRVREGISATLDQKLTEARELLKKQPGNASAIAMITKIERDGRAALGEDDIRTAVMDAKADAAAKKGAGWTPWSGEYANTAAPVGRLEQKNTMLFDQWGDGTGRVFTKSDLKSNPDMRRYLSLKDQEAIYGRSAIDTRSTK